MAKVIVTMSYGEHRGELGPIVRVHQKATYIIGDGGLLFVDRDSDGKRIAVYAKWASVEAAGREAGAPE